MTTLINSGGIFLRRHLPELGISRSDFAELRRSNLIRQVTYGVWVDAGVPDTQELRLETAALIKPPNAVFCRETAAWLSEVDTFKPSERFLLRPQCVVPIGAGRCRNSLVRCYEGKLADKDIVDHNGVLKTRDVLTTFELLRWLWRPYALAGADGMARAGLVTPEEVQAYVERRRGYRWVRQARQLAYLLEPLAESPGESWQRLRVIDAGFPVPRAQVPITDARGKVRAWLDLALVEWKVGLEYDGREFHTEDYDEAHDNTRRRYVRNVHAWRIAVARREDIFGNDMAFERQVGEWIGREPLPRSW
ncbi:MAG: hypothetical protein L0K86_10460 [Actinomycetia bacterium]|nr:hypothetical protein [Actinomycetes bacterium]